MMAYFEAAQQHRDRRTTTLLELILQASENGAPDALDRVKSFARIALGQRVTSDEMAAFEGALSSLPAERFGRPEDGLGHLVVTVSYEPIDRQSILEHAHNFRVRKGPVMPSRQILRERTLQTLEGVLEKIESIEADGATGN